MKRIKRLKWLIAAVLLVIGLSACGSSRISPQVSVGMPMQKGKAPAIGLQWY